MKWLRIFAVVACIAMTLTATAQEVEYTFKPHAYLTLQGGAQYTLGEAPFGDHISPNVQFGVGYQIMPWFGFRVVANAWQSRGGFSGVYDSNSAETVRYKWA